MIGDSATNQNQTEQDVVQMKATLIWILNAVVLMTVILMTMRTLTWALLPKKQRNKVFDYRFPSDRQT